MIDASFGSPSGIRVSSYAVISIFPINKLFSIRFSHENREFKVLRINKMFDYSFTTLRYFKQRYSIFISFFASIFIFRP